MTNKNLAKPYDPQLETERSVLARKEWWINEVRGHKHMVRTGEEYIISCTCRELLVTADSASAFLFALSHEGCEEADAPQMAEAQLADQVQ